MIDWANCDAHPAGAVWTDKKGMTAIQRNDRTSNEEPRVVPWPVSDADDVVAVDTTWGKHHPRIVKHPA